MKNQDKRKRCPKCKQQMGTFPAISRFDDRTEICSNCGALEALLIIGLTPECVEELIVQKEHDREGPDLHSQSK